MAEIHGHLLKDYAYFQTGGTCEHLYAPESLEELSSVVARLAQKQMPYFLLGGGTNSLVSDAPYAGAVVIFERLRAITEIPGGFRTQAGVDNSVFAQHVVGLGHVGAGWMNRLPGQIGGTVRMNARCYGGEISQIVQKVRAVMPDGRIEEFADPKMFRGYKDTIFMTNGAVIFDCDVALEKGDTRATLEQMAFCESDRTGKRQFEFPTCGCVFKNDYSVGVSSGMLLDAAGVKNLKHAGAEINPQHANFVFNKGASSRSIMELTFKMRQAVWQKFGVWLSYEMEILGTLPEDLALQAGEVRAHEFKESELEPLRQKFQKALKHS